MGRHWRLRVGASRRWSSLTTKGEGELILWAWWSAVPTRVCIVLVIHVLLALRPRRLRSWLLLTTVGHIVHFTLMTLRRRSIPSIHRSLVVLKTNFIIVMIGIKKQNHSSKKNNKKNTICSMFVPAAAEDTFLVVGLDMGHQRELLVQGTDCYRSHA